jgi:hypothetical protein
MTTVADVVCTNPDCRISETGECVEGLDIESCPRLKAERNTSQSPIPETVNEEELQAVADIALPKAQRLNLEEASSIMRTASTKLVAIIGPIDCGKTSLIACLCYLYQLGPIRTLRFAKSRTFLAFEQACHDARAASLRNAPTMEHTQRGGVGFFHLALQQNAGRARDLLLGDRNGEDYRTVTDDTSIAKEFYEVHRANVITMLVNGESLLDLGKRHGVKREVRLILQGLLEGNAINPRQRLALVLTKYDSISRAPDEQKRKASEEFEMLKRTITDRYGELFASINSFQISASPSQPDCEFGYGVAELLEFWMAQDMITGPRQQSLPKSSRAMGRLPISN